MDRQKFLISESEGILKKCKIENFGDADSDLKQVLKENNEESDKQISEGLVEEVKVLQANLFDLNKSYLLPGVGEAMDIDDKKKNNESSFAKVFKIILSILMFVSLIQYAFLGSKGLKPGKKNMRMMTEDSRKK